MDILKDKGAVVTGAASGIGKAIATAFIEAGASVLLCDRQCQSARCAARELGRSRDRPRHRRVGREPGRSCDARGTRGIRLVGHRRQQRGLRRHFAAHRAVRREVEIRPGRHPRRRLLRREARRPADARAGTCRRHHQHLVGERTAAGRGAVGLLRGKGRRRHAHTLRRAGTRRPRDSRRRHRARHGGDAVDEEGAGESRDARDFPRDDPDEARRSRRKRSPRPPCFSRRTTRDRSTATRSPSTAAR